MKIYLVPMLLAASLAQAAPLAIINTDASCESTLVASGCGKQTYGVPSENSLVRTRVGSDADPWSDPTFKWAPLSSVAKYEGCTDLAAPADMNATGGPCTTWAWFATPGYITKVGTPTWTFYKGSTIVKPQVPYSSLDTCAGAAPKTVAATYSCRANVAVTIAKQTTPVVIGSADLRWTPPTQNTDGSALTDLDGFRVLYGPAEDKLLLSISTKDTGVIVDNLTQGAWFFGVRAVTKSGAESTTSAIVRTTIE